METLSSLDYEGPVSLSCDDTKLSPGLDPVYDQVSGKYLVLGGTGTPLQIAEPEELAEAIAEGRIQEADKVS